ncbi:flagellar protein FlgN [Neobacillus niacini]|jgi:flagellar biosynthesis/type III secretory pathway chaperone|uniref:flagellar protein FlgN n=1 Tax=Neobacillus niacini TaxID=86668 RepID=UPI002FFF9BDB
MNNLTEVLQMLTDLHITLLETAKKKQEILITAEINPLLGIMADESKLIKKIKEVDEMRMEVLEHDKSYLPLSKLIEHQPDGVTKAEWESKLKLLQRLFEEIDKVNKHNQQLIQQSLTYTQFMIEQMLPQSKDSGLYSSEAEAQDSREYARLFDLKA